MTEDQAKAWLENNVPRETVGMLHRFVELVIAKSGSQNLISLASIDHIWSRHIVDSVQLIGHAPMDGRWADLGAGAGFPGMVVGIVGRHHVTLVETRAKRVAFLAEAVAALDLADRVTVRASKVEQVEEPPFDVISARAFAPLDRLLETAHHLSGATTRWILPKGRSAASELEVARRSWQGDFTAVPSITDPEAAIILAQNVRRRAGVHSNRSMR